MSATPGLPFRGFVVIIALLKWSLDSFIIEVIGIVREDGGAPFSGSFTLYYT